MRALNGALAPVPFLTYPEAKEFIQQRGRAQRGSSISFIYSGPTSAGAILQALLSEIVVPECKMPQKSIRTAVSEFID